MKQQLSLKDLFLTTIVFIKEDDEKYTLIIKGLNNITKTLINECIHDEHIKYRGLIGETSSMNIKIQISPGIVDNIYNAEITFLSTNNIFVRNIAGVVFHLLNKPYFEDVRSSTTKIN